MLAIFYFYRSICLITGLVSLVLWGFAYFPIHRDFHLFLPRYIIIKLITDFILWRYMRKGRIASQHYFYHNLGISEKRLYLTAFGMDQLAFFSVVAAVKMYSLL